MISNETISYNYEQMKRDSLKETLREIYNTLEENGYDPLNHLSGYILTGDPTYIPRMNDSRIKITKYDREELLIELLGNYIAK
jgi:uncharacterized protein (UPF0297 family)